MLFKKEPKTVTIRATHCENRDILRPSIARTNPIFCNPPVSQ